MATTKQSFTLIGKSTFIEGTTIHEPSYSQHKTAFYTKLFKEGLLQTLMPFSTDKKGYALIVPETNGIRYYAGVISDESVANYESVTIPTQDYVISKASSDNSRLLFDQLEDNYFKTTSANLTDHQQGILLEVLLNGNPMDAEVELWVAINE